MNKKIFASVLAGALLASVAGAMPAHAGKKAIGGIGIIKGGLPFDNHGTKAGGNALLPGTCSTKKLCTPWALIPAWPTQTDTPVTAVGGHIHKQYLADKNNDGVAEAYDQQINLVDGNSKGPLDIEYNELGGCATGTATGTLPAVKRHQSPLTDPLMKTHNMPEKADKAYSIAYARVGNTAVIVALGVNKAETIVAELVFHADTTPADLVARCSTPFEDPRPLKIYFDVNGIQVPL